MVSRSEWLAEKRRMEAGDNTQGKALEGVVLAAAHDDQAFVRHAPGARDVGGAAMTNNDRAELVRDVRRLEHVIRMPVRDEDVVRAADMRACSV